MITMTAPAGVARAVGMSGTVYNIADDGTASIAPMDVTWLMGRGWTLPASSAAGAELQANKGIASGYCPLGSDVKVPAANLQAMVASGTGHAAGYAPDPGASAGTTHYLREDATWVVPPDTNTTYSVMVGSGATHATGLTPDTPSQAGTTKYLREDGTWTVPPDTVAFLPLANNITNVSGQSDFQIIQARETTNATPGYDTYIQAGGAKLGGTDLVGGNIRLSRGVSTGTGTSGLTVLAAPAGSTGTADNAPVEMLAIQGAAIGVFGKAATPAAQAAAPAAALTAITYTAPVTPDYALQNLTDTGGFGFASADEGNTALSVIANLQARLAALETAMMAFGWLAERPA